MKKEAVILGYSGHAYVVLDILINNQYNIAGYYDSENKAANPFQLKYLGAEDSDGMFNAMKKFDAFIGIGNNHIRTQVFNKLQQGGVNCPVAVHGRSVVSPFAEIGPGTVVMAGAVINAMSKIGNAVVCNTSCVIEHECIIGNFTHIAPGAVLAGNVCVGENSFIGANAVIKQDITIGRNVIVGAGAVVVKNIADGATVYGNPAESKK